MTAFHAFLGASLDGFIAGPDGDLGFLETYGADLGDTGYDAFMARTDALLMGRTTFETVRGFGEWPYGEVRLLVLSSTLPAGPQEDGGLSWVVVPDVASAVAALADAGHVYVDGGATVRALLAAGLLDDLVITRLPVILGAGTPIFGPVPAPVPAQLVDVRRLGAGAVQETYSF